MNFWINKDSEKHNIIVIKLSPIFIILSIVSVSIFSYTMFNISRLPTPEEERKKCETYAEQSILVEEAQRTGKTIEEIKHHRQEKIKKFELMDELSKAIKFKNNDAVSKIVDQLEKGDISNIGGSGFILATAIQSNNKIAVHLLLQKSVACSNQSNTGRAAYNSAFESANPTYLRMLLENNCTFEVTSQHSSVEKGIINSKYPINLFLLSEKYVKTSYRNKAFFKAINRGMYQQVLKMLELGASPNTISEDLNALNMSIFAKKTKISFLLIDKGADITAKSKQGGHALTAAFMKGELDVVREILKRDPDYIQREKIESTIISKLFHFVKNPATLQESMMLLIDKGADRKNMITHYPWLRKAINLQDSIMAENLLTLGKGLFKPASIQKALSYAESKKFNVYHKNKIISLLQQYNIEGSGKTALE